MRYGNKAIILVDDKFYCNRLEVELEASSVRPTEISELASMDALRSRAAREGGLNFIRECILSAIQNEGTPFIIAICPYTHVFKTPSEDKTALISFIMLTYMMLASQRDYEGIHASFFVPFRDYEFENIKRLKNDYSKYFDFPVFMNDKISAIVQRYRGDKKLFDSLFTFDYLDFATDQAAFSSKIKLYSKAIEKRRSFTVKKAADSPEKLIVETVSEECVGNVYFRNSRLGCIIDGVKVADSDFPPDVPFDEITLRGMWGNRNLIDVNDKLIMTVGLLLENKTLNYNSELYIFARNECRVDGSVAASAANLLIKMFGRFKATYLCASLANEKIISRSAGATLIRSHLKIVY